MVLIITLHVVQYLLRGLPNGKFWFYNFFRSIWTRSICTLSKTTATPFVTPTWGSVLRAQQSTDAIQINHTPTGLGSAEQGWLTGRRPAFNLKFPRGYYNK